MIKWWPKDIHSAFLEESYGAQASIKNEPFKMVPTEFDDKKFQEIARKARMLCEAGFTSL